MFQALITIPETKVFVNKSYNAGSGFTSDELLVLNSVKAEITDNICWGTQIYKNEKVVCLIGETSLTELDDYITLYNLDWLILAASNGMIWDIEEQKYIKNLLKNFKYSKLKKFLVEKKDEEGEPIPIPDGEEDFGKFMGDIILVGEN